MTTTAPTEADLIRQAKNMPAEWQNLGYHELNAMLNLYGADGRIQFEADHAAARQYFLQHVNTNTVFFHDLEEKLDYLQKNDYYETETFEQYPFEFIRGLFDRAYKAKFRFPTFLGAFKFYTSYALKTFDGKRYLERYEDRVAVVALHLARGDQELATHLVDEMIAGRFQPATPTFLNSGKKQRGELVSCFLLRIEDNMESIARGINSALQLSKRGGGVALSLTNIREHGAPIKQIENQSSGVIPVMKLLEDSFSYANQLGARQGAGAVYLNAHHPDIHRFLDTKRENADEKIRIKTLSLGVVIPDITFQLAKKNEDMYLFSPYDVERVYGVPFSEISVTEKYYEMVDDARIKKTKINAREFFQTIAEIQFESGYPYVVFEDTVNAANPIKGRITMSNLCSEILQVSEASEYNEDLSYAHVGQDISCNLGSMNIAKTMDSPDFGRSVETAIRALTAVSVMSDIQSVPSIAKGNAASHAIGLGQMNLHGYLARERVHYGSEEGIDFTNMYFYAVLFHALRASNRIAIETGQRFGGFEDSKYASGEFFDKYTDQEWAPATERVADVLDALNELLGAHIFPEKADGSNPRTCPTCGSGQLSLKLGKFGAFVGCSNYPDCKFTRPLGATDERTGEWRTRKGSEIETSIYGRTLTSDVELSDGRVIAEGSPRALLDQHFGEVVLELPAGALNGAGDAIAHTVKGEWAELVTDDVNATLSQLM